MDQAHETIIKDEIPYENGKIKVTVDHLLDAHDEDEVYTGCYRATLGNGKIINLELNQDAIWVETGSGPTELAKVIGVLIENNSE